MRQPLGLIFQAERGGRHRDEVGLPPLLSCDAD
jgi:hypothetical protein